MWTSGRATLYVNKRVALETLVISSRKDWASVRIGKGESAVTIWSIYSPSPARAKWTSPLQKLPYEPPPGRHVLLGDFNLYHPLWDLSGRTSYGSEELFKFMAR